MQTPFKDNYIQPRLLKTETSNVIRTQALMVTLSKMQPIRKNLSEAAAHAAEALAFVLKIAGCDSKEHLPLIDGIDPDDDKSPL